MRLDRAIYEEPGRIYAITTCTLNRASVFCDTAFGLECIELLESMAESFGVQVYAYCLMPDHVHLLVTANGTDIARFVGAWKSRCYSIAHERGRHRKLWQRSFHDHVLRSDEGVRSVAKYILGNPVRAGLVADSRDYPLSGSLVFEL